MLKHLGLTEEEINFRGAIFIGAENTGKTYFINLIIEKILGSGRKALYSDNGITSEMIEAIQVNLNAAEKQPLYLFIDKAERIDESFDILNILRNGHSDKIHMLLAYKTGHQIPDGFMESFGRGSKVIFRTVDEFSADYCSSYCSRMLGDVKGVVSREDKRLYHITRRVVTPAEIIKMPSLCYFII